MHKSTAGDVGFVSSLQFRASCVQKEHTMACNVVNLLFEIHVTVHVASEWESILNRCLKSTLGRGTTHDHLSLLLFISFGPTSDTAGHHVCDRDLHGGALVSPVGCRMPWVLPDARVTGTVFRGSASQKDLTGPQSTLC